MKSQAAHLGFLFWNIFNDLWLLIMYKVWAFWCCIKKNWAKNRTNWGKWNKWETRKEQRVRKKADAEREKVQIYLMQCACKSVYEAQVVVCYHGNIGKQEWVESSVNKKPHRFHGQIIIPKFLFFRCNCSGVFTCEDSPEIICGEVNSWNLESSATLQLVKTFFFLR